MRNRLSIILGKSVQKIARIRGGGSALPGLFIEKVSPEVITSYGTDRGEGGFGHTGTK